MSELPNVEHSYTTELVRKAIHLSSLSIPIIYYFIPRATALAILIPLTAAFVIVDSVRFFHRASGEIFHSYFGWLLRTHERNTSGVRRLTGATFVLLSATICVLVFPKIIVITAFAIMIISDSSAALVGRRFGRHPFLRKSLEGTAAFFVSALLVVALAPKVLYLPTEYLIGIVASLLGALVEASSGSVDDNLSIPVSIGAAMWLMYVVLLPDVNIFVLDGRV
jgi:dolichol kinase